MVLLLPTQNLTSVRGLGFKAEYYLKQNDNNIG